MEILDSGALLHYSYVFGELVLESHMEILDSGALLHYSYVFGELVLDFEAPVWNGCLPRTSCWAAQHPLTPH